MWEHLEISGASVCLSCHVQNLVWPLQIIDLQLVTETPDEGCKGSREEWPWWGVSCPQSLDGLCHYGGVWWVGFLEEAMLGTQGR